jgi:CubicO group peptidase (beta-lactamase class C family)
MTAASIGMLVDAGRVAWDDPAERHLPAFRLSDAARTREVSVRDLLTHRAGMPNADYLWYRSGLSPADILKRFALVPTETSLRSQFRYQNVMYHAAGELIGAVSGTPWPEFVQARLFDPIGMRRTRPLFARLRADDEPATPHFELDGGIAPIRNAPVDSVAAAGAVWSSAEDMAEWMRFLLRGGSVGGRPLLKPATLDELFTPQTTLRRDDFYPSAELTRPNWTTYGLGWFQQDYAGRKLDFHTGSIDGMVAICGLVRGERLGVFVLANLDHAELRHALMLRVLDVWGPGAGRDWSSDLRALYARNRDKAKEAQHKLEAQRVAGTQPALPLDRYAGRYSDPLYGSVDVTRGADGLRVGVGPEMTGRLEHWQHDTFRVVWDMAWLDPLWLRFDVNARGDVARALLGDLGQPDATLMGFARENAGAADAPPAP